MVTPQSAVDPNLIALQDGLRSIRSFVTGFAGSTTDQSWAGEDQNVYNTPYRYTTVGPNGVAVEGSSYGGTVNQQQPNATPPPTVLMLAAAAVVAYLMLK